MKMNVELLICLVLMFSSSTRALQCYLCSANEADERCATDPESNAIIYNCEKNYCTSMRQDFLDPKGKLRSMTRTCEDDPPIKNEVIEDAWWRYYYVACQEDLCNGGNGKDTDGSKLPNRDRGFGVLYVPGIGSTGSIQLLSKFAMWLLLSIVFLHSHYFV